MGMSCSPFLVHGVHLCTCSPVHTGFGRAMVNRQYTEYRDRRGTGCGPHRPDRAGVEPGQRTRGCCAGFVVMMRALKGALGGVCYEL